MTPTTIEKTTPLTAEQYFAAKVAYEITPWSLKALLEKSPASVVLLDVRGPESWAEGRIPGARHLPLAELPAKLASLPKDKTILPYCGSLTCSLAPKAALLLAQNGFAVREVLGGVAEWTRAGFPLEK